MTLDFVKGAEAEGKEKHVPHIEVGKGHDDVDLVKVVVGHETPHPNTAEHHISWIDLFGTRKDNGQVLHLGRASWAPVQSNPNVRFQLNAVGDYKAFHALAYCNLHGVWGNTLEM